MNDSFIGIRVADGTFYSVLEEASSAKKKLVLTTVNDDQTSVQIDLYRGESSDMINPSYIGSLVVEEIRPKTAGEADIELVLGVDEEGNLNASAGDLSSGEHQSLSVSLESLKEDEFDIPEFDLDMAIEEETSSVSVNQEESSEIDDFLEEDLRRNEKSRLLLILALVLLGLGLVTGAALLLYKAVASDSAPVLAEVPAETVEETVTVEEEVVSPEPAAEEPVTDAVTEETSEALEGIADPAEELKEAPVREFVGVNYRIRWGDTLWDLSETFYRTPWLYGKIARENEIKNPDLIYADTEIRIPAAE